VVWGSKVIQHAWLLKAARKILSLFSAKEVKTPLSFFGRMGTGIFILAALGVCLVQPTDKLELLIGAGAFLLFLVMVVAVITWCRPQNLVLGESGYRSLPAKPAISPSTIDGRNRPAA
jgi:hypothetical protein